jgi:uncharacterized membrane protein YedE/YeeE
MKANISALLTGFIFAVGLGISGMTDANKVIAFLDLAGNWDPSLALVMVGAIGTHLVLMRLILRRQSPLFAGAFGLPTHQDIDKKLIVGAGLFGIGWGLGGFCPGPAMVSSASLAPEAMIFTAAMVAGMVAHGALKKAKVDPSPPVATSEAA